MPELVYNVRFEVDSSNLKKITSGIDPNASREVQNLNQEIQRLKDNLNKIKSPSEFLLLNKPALSELTTEYIAPD